MTTVLRWGLVVPAIAFGFFFPGLFIMTLEFGNLHPITLLTKLPFVGEGLATVFRGVGDLIHSLASGGFAVGFAAWAAPSHRNWVGLIAAFTVCVFAAAAMLILLASGESRGVSVMYLLWEFINVASTIATAAFVGFIAWHVAGKQQTAQTDGDG